MPLTPSNPGQSGPEASITGAQIRQALLDAIGQRSNLQTGTVLGDVCSQLGLHDPNQQEAVLTMFYDLFRTGHLAWGINALNPNPPHFHSTERGRIALQHISRDPINSDGYLAYLNSHVTLNPVAKSYINEALQTFNADCYKATAVMTGCAAESITLELRDSLVSKMTSQSLSFPQGMRGWQIAPIVRAITVVLDSKKQLMSQTIKERYEMFWLGFSGQIRIARNEAGHPASIEPVSYETVHASLLIFPDQAKLTLDLTSWVTSHM